MIEHRAFKFRLNPTKDQEQLLRQMGGNTRFLYNKLLELSITNKETTGKFIFGKDLIKAVVPLKEEHPFLKLSYSQSLQGSAENLERAFQNCFIHHINKFPTQKKKRENDSFIYKQNWSLGPKSIKLPKLGRIRMVKHRPLVGEPTSVTIVQDGDLWFASILCRIEVQEPEFNLPDEDNFVGIDVGIKEFAVVSDETIVNNPKFLKKRTKKLRRASRWVSRKEKGSNNRNKARKRLRSIHRKIKNSRKDFHHKISHSMTAKYSGIAIETLNIQGMLKNHKIAKAIADCGWGQFLQFLDYKNKSLGKFLIKIGQRFPSSKTCSECGNKMDISLKERTYICTECGLVIDRDFNAAINIRNQGWFLLQEMLNDSETLLTGGEEGEGESPRYACG